MPLFLAEKTLLSMTNFIPIYPQQRVVFPDEVFSFEVTEQRYRQLIKDCQSEDKPFGLPTSDRENNMDYGTTVQILEMEMMDGQEKLKIKAKGISVFRILEVMDHLPDKPYWGAIVHYPENDQLKVHHRTSKLIFEEVKKLYQQLQLEQLLPLHEDDWTSYELAHKIGLSKQQEYQLLSILNEVQRMEFIRRHLRELFSALDSIALLKSRINLN